MVKIQITIINRLGLHARAAAKFITEAGQYSCEILLARDDKPVNGKSIMEVMMLAASQGTELTLTTSGEDEVEAANALETLINDRFGEPE
ncbi:MAG: HPr family phosphocarrier protein [Sedimenticola sp.]|nr:HPr family phosphocarrier protein [Sedimenticola sp.]MCW8882581.1 HPr family phosphocarrier protein [Sedimenticola sp.]MCW8946992.1 HPr family phosphocarrier protein [Sedimenticola sp.]MCW8950712.1 HPr family phosphocarrier protein [Sedimenticola sp.]MCW8974893.1 HPr family phosphocarrier protein [Sedimenticola sp.]